MLPYSLALGLPCWLSGNESACQCRRRRFDLWLGRSPEEGNDNPLQYSCLGNTMDRGTWQATIHGIARVGHNLMTKPSPCSNKPCGQGQLHNLQNPVQNKNVGSFVLKTGKSVSKHITISNFSFLPQSLSSSHGGFYSVFNGVHS